MTADVFAPLHHALARGATAAARKSLIDGKRIAAPFRGDLNHAWYLVGQSYWREGEFAAAAACYRRALKLRPDDHEAMMAVASCLSELGDARGAVRWLGRAIAIAPRSASLRFNLGNAYFDLQRWDRALGAYVAARQRSSADPALRRLIDRNIAITRELRAARDLQSDAKQRRPPHRRANTQR